MALFKRSVYLSSDRNPCLKSLTESDANEFAELEAVLSLQSSSEAHSAGEDLIRQFYELLTRLIGASLTERLLQSVWENPSNGNTAQDSPL